MLGPQRLCQSRHSASRIIAPGLDGVDPSGFSSRPYACRVTVTRWRGHPIDRDGPGDACQGRRDRAYLRANSVESQAWKMPHSAAIMQSHFSIQLHCPLRIAMTVALMPHSSCPPYDAMRCIESRSGPLGRLAE